MNKNINLSVLVISLLFYGNLIAQPNVTDGNITITTMGSGQGGAFAIGDMVTAEWDNSSSGDNNTTPAVTSVNVNFGQFGGPIIAASESSDIWTASYTIVAGTIDLTNRNVIVSATDGTGTTTVPDDDNKTVDNIRPEVTISSSEFDPTSATPITIDIVFDEAVSNFVSADISVSGGAKSGFTGSGTTYAVDVTPSSSEETITVNVAAGVADDDVGNTNNAASQFTIEHDSKKPSVTISSSESDPTNASPITIDIVFDESVTGLMASEIVVTGGTKGALSGIGATYAIDVTPSSSEETITVDIAAGVATDGLNTSNAALTFTIDHDSKKPSVTISSLEFDPTNNSPIQIDIVFDESVSGLMASEIDVTGGTKGSLSGSGTTYAIDVTPSSSEVTITVDISAGVAGDNAGNTNNVAFQFTIEHDSQKPSITISSLEPDPTNSSPIQIDIVFDESISGLMASEIDVTGGTKGSLSGIGTTYAIDVTPSSSEVTKQSILRPELQLTVSTQTTQPLNLPLTMIANHQQLQH